MTNKNFDNFLKQTIKNYGDDYINFSEEWNKPHEFSPKFERKMSKLIKRERKPYFSITNTPIRKITTITAAAIIVASSLIMNIVADNEVKSSYMAFVYKTHTQLVATKDENAPKNFKEIYEITAIPKDYEIVYKDDDYINNLNLITIYKNKYNSFYNFDFKQNLKFLYDVNVNTEYYKMEHIEINGCEGRIVKMEDGGFLTWDNGDYIFEITGSIDTNSMIEMAKSVKKVE